MAPEQALELPGLDHRSDVWSFCVVLYEALSGTLPFRRPTFAQTLCSLLGREPAPLTEIGIDPALWRIIEQGLCKAPSDRWQNMHDLGNALAEWLVSRGVTVDVSGAAIAIECDIDEAGGETGAASSLNSLPKVIIGEGA
jgi:serine/threonine-protein kinase